MGKGKERGWILLVGLTLTVLLAGVCAVSCGGALGQRRGEEVAGGGTDATEETQSGAEAGQAGADLEHPSKGQQNAPVLIIEHSDYQ